MIHLTPSFLIWATYVSLVCAGAILRGGASERAGGLIILFGWGATVVVMDPGWWRAPGPVLAVDFLVLVALVALALRSERYWPLWAAGFHLLAVATHLARSLDPDLNPWAYITGEILWGYLLVTSLAIGTWGAWRQTRQLTNEGDVSAPPGATLR